MKEIKCPNCNDNLVEIIYGMPQMEYINKAKKKEVYLGGCEIVIPHPIYHCYKCNRNYYKNLKDYEIDMI